MLDFARLLRNTFSIMHNGKSGNANLTLKISVCVLLECHTLHTLRSEKRISSSAK